MATAQQGTAKRTSTWTIANTVTVLRIVLIPVFLLFMLLDWATPLVGTEAAANVQPWTCTVLYALISLTDGIDGYLARSRNEVTVFGKFMDPIADKLLVITALIVLVQFGSLPSWIPIVIVARELLVSGLRMVVAAAGVVVAASFIGKAKTAVTLVAICLFIVKDTPVLDPLQPGVSILAWTMMIAAVILTIWSMVDYFMKSWPYLMDEPAPSSARAAAAGSSDRKPTATVPAQASRSKPSIPKDALEGAHPLAAKVVNEAILKGVRLGSAESCTGGLVAASLTSVPGSSEVVCGGVASYMASVKEAVLGVDHAVIEANGVVSGETAESMATGARAALGADLCVSTTGVAGPSGGDEANPVGTVWFGVSDPSGTRSERVVFQGCREEVRAQAVDYALGLFLERLVDWR